LRYRVDPCGLNDAAPIPVARRSTVAELAMILVADKVMVF
jgi:hypothetical protein